jgi:soluble lytic murein transglycosylase-like protein
MKALSRIRTVPHKTRDYPRPAAQPDKLSPRQVGLEGDVPGPGGPEIIVPDFQRGAAGRGDGAPCNERSDMQNLVRASALARAARRATAESIAVFLRDAGQGLLEVSHNSLALLGLILVAALLFVGGREDLRHDLEAQALTWLQARQEARVEPQVALEEEMTEPDAVIRATAADPRELDRQQGAVAQWLSRRYRVAPEPISRLVQEAWHLGARAGLDPTLILAIMAVESSFNPFAQSSVGAQGLMQVMTKVHDDKYEPFGGVHAAFDPVTNLRVGVQVLKECIARAGSLEAGLRFYVGAGNIGEDGGYAAKVLSEQGHLRQVASGRAVPYSSALASASVHAPAPAAAPAPTPAPAAAEPDKAAESAPPEQLALLR